MVSSKNNETGDMAGSIATKPEYCHGYIHCPMNDQLGFAFAQWTDQQTILLYLDIVQEVSCTEMPITTDDCVRSPNINEFMKNYVKSRFYAMYPNHLALDWVFVGTEKGFDRPRIPSLNESSPFSVSANIPHMEHPSLYFYSQ